MKPENLSSCPQHPSPSLPLPHGERGKCSSWRERVDGGSPFPAREGGWGVRLRLLLCLLALLCLALPLWAQAPGPQEYGRVEEVPRQEFDRWLKEQVERSGGDFENERYHFVVGFSTGHYGSDPVHAIAMRRLAFGLLNNSLAVGDQVTPLAWEMDVWDVGSTLTLDEDPATRARFVDAVPYAPASGSRGGHDTERSLYSALRRAVPEGGARHTIVLLLTNSNQSQVPTGSRERLFGANNPLLSRAIRSRGYREPVRKSFTAGAGNRRLSLDVTALFPRAIEPLPGAPTTSRYPTFPVETWQPAADRPAADQLPNPAQQGEGQQPEPGATGPSVAAERTFPWPLLLLGLLLLAAVVIGILYWLQNRPPKPAQQAAAKPAPKGRPIPGEVAVTLGSEPRVLRVPLKGLTTESRWVLAQNGDALPTLTPTDAEKKPEGEPLAQVSLDEKRRLRVEAAGETQFAELRGVNVEGSNNRLLLLAPGERLVCRVTSATAARQPVRLELNYLERAG